ncbi:hypothetical protein JXB31_02035 [Candidatus Woesearchaeota archaeon]|nr:hypothetical protein [Candidatus Woesearchaeota archaeon]
MPLIQIDRKYDEDILKLKERLEKLEELKNREVPHLTLSIDPEKAIDPEVIDPKRAGQGNNDNMHGLSTVEIHSIEEQISHVKKMIASFESRHASSSEATLNIRVEQAGAGAKSKTAVKRESRAKKGTGAKHAMSAKASKKAVSARAVSARASLLKSAGSSTGSKKTASGRLEASVKSSVKKDSRTTTATTTTAATKGTAVSKNARTTLKRQKGVGSKAKSKGKASPAAKSRGSAAVKGRKKSTKPGEELSGSIKRLNKRINELIRIFSEANKELQSGSEDKLVLKVDSIIHSVARIFERQSEIIEQNRKISEQNEKIREQNEKIAAAIVKFVSTGSSTEPDAGHEPGQNTGSDAWPDAEKQAEKEGKKEIKLESLFKNSVEDIGSSSSSIEIEKLPLAPERKHSDKSLGAHQRSIGASTSGAASAYAVSDVSPRKLRDIFAEDRDRQMKEFDEQDKHSEEGDGLSDLNDDYMSDDNMSDDNTFSGSSEHRHDYPSGWETELDGSDTRPIRMHSAPKPPFPSAREGKKQQQD